jgi:hypothetical protein
MTLARGPHRLSVGFGDDEIVADRSAGRAVRFRDATGRTDLEHMLLRIDILLLEHLRHIRDVIVARLHHHKLALVFHACNANRTGRRVAVWKRALVRDLSLDPPLFGWESSEAEI